LEGPLEASSVEGHLAVFGGGDASNLVEVFDTVSLHWTYTSLSEQRRYLTAASVNSLALFAGGWSFDTSAWSTRVDIYNAIAGEWTIANLSIPRGS
jgi:hypothetical protein